MNVAGKWPNLPSENQTRALPSLGTAVLRVILTGLPNAIYLNQLLFLILPLYLILPYVQGVGGSSFEYSRVLFYIWRPG